MTGTSPNSAFLSFGIPIDADSLCKENILHLENNPVTVRRDAYRSATLRLLIKNCSWVLSREASAFNRGINGTNLVELLVCLCNNGITLGFIAC